MQGMRKKERKSQGSKDVSPGALSLVLLGVLIATISAYIVLRTL